MTVTASGDLSIQVRFCDQMMVTLAGSSPLVKGYAGQSPIFMGSTIGRCSARTASAKAERLKAFTAQDSETASAKDRRTQRKKQLLHFALQPDPIPYPVCVPNLRSLVGPRCRAFRAEDREEKELRPIFSLDSGSSLCFGPSGH